MVIAHFFARLRQGAAVTRPACGASEAPILVRHFDTWINMAVLVAFVGLPMEIAEHPSLARHDQSTRIVVAACVTVQLAVWRSSSPLVSIPVHALFMCACGFTQFVSTLFLNLPGTSQYVLGLVPLVLLRFAGRTVATAAAILCYAVMCIASALLYAGYPVGTNSFSPQASMLFFGPFFGHSTPSATSSRARWRKSCVTPETS
jgi:hypothetical protein